MIKKYGQPAAGPNGLQPHFSTCVRANGFLFLSGQMAFDENGVIVGDDITTQTKQCLLNIEEVLALAGADRHDVVKVMVWLTEPKDFSNFNNEYRAFFPSPPPARSTVASALMVPGALIEIEVIAISK